MNTVNALGRRQWLKTSGAALATLACSSKLAATSSGAGVATRNTGGPVRLSLNENSMGPAPAAIRAMQEHLSGVYRYPNTESRSLLKLLAEKEGVSTSQIVIGSGSGEVLEAYGSWMGKAGGEVVTAWPSYRQLVGAMERRGTKAIEVPLTDRKELDLEAMAAAITLATQCVYICNPNNPTGTIVDPVKLRAFIIEVSQRVPVFVDEAYLECSDNFEANTMVGLVGAGHNVTVSRTFSKIHALAGQRIGYAVLPDGLAQPVRAKIKGGTNMLAMVGAQASLEDEGYVETMRRKIKSGRDEVIALLRELKLEYAEPQGSFVFFRTGIPIDDFKQNMGERGVLVGRAFPPYEDWCRISIGTPKEMAVARSALREILG